MNHAGHAEAKHKEQMEHTTHAGHIPPKSETAETEVNHYLMMERERM